MKRRVLDQLRMAFASVSAPDEISAHVAHEHRSQKLIRKIFGRRPPESLSRDEVVTLILDAALITPEAFWYFLPKMAEGVLFENDHAFMLLQRLETMSTDGLSVKQRWAVTDLLKLLRQEVESADREA
jgi:hypothetical protein